MFLNSGAAGVVNGTEARQQAVRQLHPSAERKRHPGFRGQARTGVVAGGLCEYGHEEYGKEYSG